MGQADQRKIKINKQKGKEQKNGGEMKKLSFSGTIWRKEKK